MSLKSDTNQYPLKTLLNLQARSARKFAIEKLWIYPSWNFTDYMSVNNDSDIKVQHWLKSIY
jgi:hypothetical protein